MKFFADFNLHSKYGRGTHPDMEIPTLAKWAKIKGLGLLGTGDCTHPQWLVELKKFLKPSSGRGVYEFDGVPFLLTSEVVCDYVLQGRVHKINHLLFFPHFSSVDRLVDVLERHGDLVTDAPPEVKLTPGELVAMAADVSGDILVVPAHAWGLHHSLFSPQFGYDRLADAYGAQADRVRVIETGLCADPAMARRWSQVDGRTLISNSDAHSPDELGREANLFDCPVDYREVVGALIAGDRSRFLATVEMFPAEDRWHRSGHRACGRRADDPRPAGDCPACGKPFTPGVAERVERLADRAPRASVPEPHFHLIPLRDVVADALGFQPDADSVKKTYAAITAQAGPELAILLEWTPERLRDVLPCRVAEGVLALRRGDVTLDPGYDGQPGRARVNIPPEVPPGGGQLKLP
jgi:uncharacterized protein (TIGR00375 family)